MWGRGMRAGWGHGLAVIVAGLSAAALAPGAGAVTLGQISYDGCVSDDGSGGLCADAPGKPLTKALGVAVSPDGKSVYVVSPVASTITHFFVAPQGQLTFDGCVSDDGSGGLCADAPGTPLFGASGVAVSPDGKSVYVASVDGSTVTHFFAAPEGQITYDGCVSSDGSGGLCADAPPVAGALGVAVSPDGKSVYVTSPNTDTVTHFFAAPQGQITYDGCVSNDGSGGQCAVAPGKPLGGAGGVAVSPDGKSVYVTGANAIAHFFAAPQGQITYDGCVSSDGSGGLCADAPPLFGARGVAVSPDGKSVYVASSGTDTIAHFSAAPQGQITYDSCVSDTGSGEVCAEAPGTPLAGADGVAVSPDGKSVYLASAGANTIANFSAAPQGRLSFSGCVSDDGSGGQCGDLPGTPLTGADGLAVSPDGTSVYATAQGSSDVVHFFRQATGGGGTHAPSLSGLTISPHRFRAGATGGAIVKGGQATISFRLDVAATVTFTVQEMVSGRRHRNGTHVRCVAVSHQNRNANRCSRTVTLGAFSVAGVSGLNHVHFSGRVGGHKLPGGATFTLVAVPTAAHRSGSSSSVSFVIKR